MSRRCDWLQTCTTEGIFAACVCPDAPDAEPPAQHRVISTSPQSAAEAETHLALAPDGTIGVVWIAVAPTGGSNIGYTFSSDGGTTWSTPAMLSDPQSRESSDPVVAVDAQGNFYVAWIAFLRSGGGDASDFKLYASKATARSKAFALPVTVDSFSSGDKPWITITKPGTVLVTYEASGVLRAARSTNGGTSFTTSTLFTPADPKNDIANFVVPCTSKTSARVWATFLTVEGQAYGQRLMWSDDDGATWPAANTNFYGQDAAAVPASCAAKGNDVFLAYGVWPGTPQSKHAPVDLIRVVHTADGTTFDRHQATDATVAKVYLPDLIMDDATSTLHLSYYGGAAEGDTKGRVYRVKSTDSAATWSNAQAISAPLTFTALRSSTDWLGDYIGSGAGASDHVTAYTENSGSYAHVAFVREPK